MPHIVPLALLLQRAGDGLVLGPVHETIPFPSLFNAPPSTQSRVLALQSSRKPPAPPAGANPSPQNSGGSALQEKESGAVLSSPPRRWLPGGRGKGILPVRAPFSHLPHGPSVEMHEAFLWGSQGHRAAGMQRKKGMGSQEPQTSPACSCLVSLWESEFTSLGTKFHSPLNVGIGDSKLPSGTL